MGANDCQTREKISTAMNKHETAQPTLISPLYLSWIHINVVVCRLGLVSPNQCVILEMFNSNSFHSPGRRARTPCDAVDFLANKRRQTNLKRAKIRAKDVVYIFFPPLVQINSWFQFLTAWLKNFFWAPDVRWARTRSPLNVMWEWKTGHAVYSDCRAWSHRFLFPRSNARS